MSPSNPVQCLIDNNFPTQSSDELPTQFPQPDGDKVAWPCEVKFLLPVPDSESIQEANLSSLESIDGACLSEIMCFLSPIEWGQLSKASRAMAQDVVAASEFLVSTYLPPHLLMSPLKVARQPDPWTLDEFRIPFQTRPQPWSPSSAAAALGPVISWGPNMLIYQALITMDISGLWRVLGTYTNGDRYNYTMTLQQVGGRRGVARLEAFVEGEVRWNDTDIMLISGKIDGNMVVLYEVMMNRANVIGSTLANVVSAVITQDGQFMSGAWLQHSTKGYDGEEILFPAEHTQRPFPVMCSGVFRANKSSSTPDWRG